MMSLLRNFLACVSAGCLLLFCSCGNGPYDAGYTYYAQGTDLPLIYPAEMKTLPNLDIKCDTTVGRFKNDSLVLEVCYNRLYDSLPKLEELDLRLYQADNNFRTTDTIERAGTYFFRCGQYFLEKEEGLLPLNGKLNFKSMKGLKRKYVKEITDAQDLSLIYFSFPRQKKPYPLYLKLEVTAKTNLEGKHEAHRQEFLLQLKPWVEPQYKGGGAVILPHL